MDEILEKVIPLRKPVIMGSETVNELKLREPIASELRQVDQIVRQEGTVAATIVLAALVSGVSKPFIDRLAARDFREAEAFLLPFMFPPLPGGSPATGATS